MEMLSIASGSSGNCIYAGDTSTHILIDAGISGKSVEAGLNSISMTTADIQAILITHEHSDHIKGLGVLARKAGIPIYATKGTLEAIKRCKALGKIDEQLYNEIKEDEEFSIGSMYFRPIRISHDAAQPVAYRFRSDKSNAAVMTDLGVFDDYIVSNLQGLDMLLLESNHDIRMLETGSYPYELKQRILGRKGHLSNENSGRLLSRVLHSGMKKILLGHLSQENNYPPLAFETVRSEIDLADNEYMSKDFDISVAKRNEPGNLIRF